MFELIWILLSKLSVFFLSVKGNYNYPAPLSEKEELVLFKKMKNGDIKAREKLIEHNLRLVVHIVKKYYSNSKEQEDLISIGTIGLIKAVDSYDISNGTRFATYAGKCLQNEILMYFRSQKKVAFETSLNDSVDVDKDGNAISWASAGTIGYKGSKKKTPFAAGMSAEAAAKAAMDNGVKKVEVFVKGLGAGREQAIRALQTAGLEITAINDETPVPHNGCRPPKRPRN